MARMQERLTKKRVTRLGKLAMPLLAATLSAGSARAQQARELDSVDRIDNITAQIDSVFTAHEKAKAEELRQKAIADSIRRDDALSLTTYGKHLPRPEVNERYIIQQHGTDREKERLRAKDAEKMVAALQDSVRVKNEELAKHRKLLKTVRDNLGKLRERLTRSKPAK